MPYSKLCQQLFRFKIFDYIDLEYVILSTSNMKVPLSIARCQFHQYLVLYKGKNPMKSLCSTPKNSNL